MTHLIHYIIYFYNDISPGEGRFVRMETSVSNLGLKSVRVLIEV